MPRPELPSRPCEIADDLSAGGAGYQLLRPRLDELDQVPRRVPDEAEPPNRCPFAHIAYELRATLEPHAEISLEICRLQCDVVPHIYRRRHVGVGELEQLHPDAVRVGHQHHLRIGRPGTELPEWDIAHLFELPDRLMKVNHCLSDVVDTDDHRLGYTKFRGNNGSPELTSLCSPVQHGSPRVAAAVVRISSPRATRNPKRLTAVPHRLSIA
jgi:hypothetical protein